MKHRKLFFISALALLALLAAPPLLATGTVSGRVADRQGNPIEDIRVVIAGAQALRTARTAASGGFTYASGATHSAGTMIHEETGEGTTTGRTFKAKTNRKGRYLASVENGAYALDLEDKSLALSEVTIHVENAEHEVVRDWTGRVLPGDPSPEFRVNSGDTITIDVVLVETETLREEYSNYLLASVAQALQDGDREGALEFVDNLLAQRADDPVGLTLRAYIYAEDGRTKEAEADLDRALDLRPDLVDAQYQLASLYRRTEREEQALPMFRKIADEAETSADRARALLNIGEMERAAGNSEAAILAFERAAEEMPDYRPQIAPELVALYTAAGQTEKAEQWLEAAPSADEMDPALQYNIAVAHFNNREWSEAAEAFRGVIAVRPDFADAHRNLGYALLNLGEQKEALAAFRKYLELSPEGAEAAEVQQLVDALSRMLEG